MKRFFVKIAYNGKNFHGWQKQNNSITIQQVIEEKLSQLYKTKIDIIGCGRTDKGVNASEFYFHFDAIFLFDNLLFRLSCMNSNRDIQFIDIFEVKPNINSRFDAISRTYKYFISKNPNPFNHQFRLRYPQYLDINNMNLACTILLQYNDFTSFSKLHSNSKTNLCKIQDAKFYYIEHDDICFEITADRFLRNMVRAIVGSMLQVGSKIIDLQEFENIIKAKNRNRAGKSVKAEALFLTNVQYDLEKIKIIPLAYMK